MSWGGGTLALDGFPKVSMSLTRHFLVHSLFNCVCIFGTNWCVGGKASWDTGKEKHMNRDEQKDTPILLISAAAPHLLLHSPITFGLEGGSHTQRSGTEDCVISFSFFHFLEDVLLKTFPRK